jgi:hypothetical protein
MACCKHRRLLAPIESNISRLHTRFENYKGNEGRVEELSSSCTRILDELTTLKQHLAPGIRRPAEHTVRALWSEDSPVTAHFKEVDKSI